MFWADAARSSLCPVGFFIFIIVFDSSHHGRPAATASRATDPSSPFEGAFSELVASPVIERLVRGHRRR